MSGRVRSLKNDDCSTQSAPYHVDGATASANANVVPRIRLSYICHQPVCDTIALVDKADPTRTHPDNNSKRHAAASCQHLA